MPPSNVEWSVELVLVGSGRYDDASVEEFAALGSVRVLAPDRVVISFTLTSRDIYQAHRLALVALDEMAHTGWTLVGLHVARVDPAGPTTPLPPLVGVAEAAKILGIGRKDVEQLLRDEPDFPAPATRLASGPVWLRSSIEEHGRRPAAVDVDASGSDYTRAVAIVRADGVDIRLVGWLHESGQRWRYEQTGGDVLDEHRRRDLAQRLVDIDLEGRTGRAQVHIGADGVLRLTGIAPLVRRRG